MDNTLQIPTPSFNVLWMYRPRRVMFRCGTGQVYMSELESHKKEEKKIWGGLVSVLSYPINRLTTSD